MIKLPATRLLISIALVLLFFLFLVAILFVTDLSFSVWEKLKQKPDWIFWSYISAVLILMFLFGRLVWRILLPKSGNKRRNITKNTNKSLNNMDAVARRLEGISQNISGHQVGAKPLCEKSSTTRPLSGAESGVEDKSDEGVNVLNGINDDQLKQWANDFDASPEVASIRQELEEYGRRKSEQTIYIALFGDISSGKSSLIKALISQGNEDQPSVQSSVVGGTTREVQHYTWKSGPLFKNQTVVLTDMPGLNEQYAELDILSTEEVKRAHIVIYLCDGDLTSTQLNELKQILLLDKPCIVAVNKSDRFNLDDRELILKNIENRLAELSDNVPVVTISAGGMRDYIRLTPGGEEERVQRPIEPELDRLITQLQVMYDFYDLAHLERLREQSVASMINNKLDDLDARFKHSQSNRMVKSYTKKAIVASMATISPGTDILVQGYLGIQMIKDLCQLYGVAATDIDANRLIELIQSRMDKTMPLLLAIAGNGLKAFPGIGTITGGLMHAVAYGMIFDTLGRSVARTLEVTGELSPALVSDLYKEKLGEDIESRTKDFIKLVLKLRKGD